MARDEDTDRDDNLLLYSIIHSTPDIYSNNSEYDEEQSSSRERDSGETTVYSPLINTQADERRASCHRRKELREVRSAAERQQPAATVARGKHKTTVKCPSSGNNPLHCWKPSSLSRPRPRLTK